MAKATKDIKVEGMAMTGVIVTKKEQPASKPKPVLGTLDDKQPIRNIVYIELAGLDKYDKALIQLPQFKAKMLTRSEWAKTLEELKTKPITK